MIAPLRIFIVAGEASGDRLGAALIKAIRETHGSAVEFQGIAGPLMEDQGMKSQFPMHELSLFGLLELLPKWRSLKRRLNETIEAVIAAQPDILITIDSPGFCLRLTAALRGKITAPAVHYVAPTVWAWRPERAQKMAAHVDHVLALLPFEPPYMEKAGISCDFVGHPLVAEIQPNDAEIVAFRATHNLDDNTRLITILPGSRNSEIKRLSPIFFETAKKIQAKIPTVQFAIPVASEHLLVPLREQLKNAGLNAILLTAENINVNEAAMQKRTCFAASELALAASGTVSIELAAAGVPMVIGYKVNFLSAWIMQRAMLAPSFTLVNLLTESKSVPEFHSKNCNVKNLSREMLELLNDPQARKAQIKIGHQAIEALGRGGENPGLRAAKSVLAQLK